MFESIDKTLISKLKNHSKIGIDKEIKIFRKHTISIKPRNLNINILAFHNSIANKYKIISDTMFFHNFRFLEFIAKRNSDVLVKTKIKTKYISKEKIKKIVETIFKDKTTIVKEFKLKELIEQRAELIYNEQKSNDAKAIQETLKKELDKFSKDIQNEEELDDRIVLYTNLNSFLTNIKINHENINYNFNKSIYLNYDSSEIKNIIKSFDSIENIEYRDIEEYFSTLQKTIKPLGITVNNIENKIDISNISKISKILNIKNISSINMISPIFAKTENRNIFNTSNEILKLISNNSTNTTNIKSEKLTKVIQNISQNLHLQLNSLFNKIDIKNDIKEIFKGELESIFINKEYTNELKIEEINNTIKNYVDNIVLSNQTTQNFKIENKSVIEEKIYEQSVNKITKLGINLHFNLKKELKTIVNKKVSKIDNINTIIQFNQVLNEVVENFLSVKNNILNNNTILKKYVSIRNTNKIISNTSIQNDIYNLIKLGDSVVFNKNYDQKVESIYESVVNQIKQIKPEKQISVINRSKLYKEINKLAKITNIEQINKEYANIINSFMSDSFSTNITKSKSIQVDKLYQTILNEITNKSSIKQINIIEKKDIFNNILKLININNSPNKTINKNTTNSVKVYKKFLYDIMNNTSLKHFSVIEKKELLKKISNFINIDKNINIENFFSEIISNTSFIKTDIVKNRNNIEEEKLYKNIINEISNKTTTKYINILNKKEIFKKISNLTKLTNENEIFNSYENIINQYNLTNISMNNILEKVEFSSEEKIEKVYKKIVNEIKKVEPSIKIENIEKNTILQKLEKVLKSGDLDLVSKEYKTILNQIINKKESKNILNNEIREEKIYKSIINEINQNTSSKYINLVDKKNIIKKISNISKIKNTTQINEEYKNIIEQYKSVNKTTNINAINLTSIGQNIVVNKNYEEKVDNIYQNIIKEVNSVWPLKQINRIEKKQILQSLNKIVKQNNIENINKEYTSIVNQLINKTKIIRTSKETIIQKIIEGTKDNIQNTTFEELTKSPNQKTLIKNMHKTRIEKVQGKEDIVYISGRELTKKKEEEKISNFNEIDKKLNEKEFQFNMTVENIYKRFDENIDELALKIFRDIKDELSMEYKRI